jgi:hypothetical protein
MKSLKELAKIIQKNRLEEIELLGADTEEAGRVSEFYEGLLQGKFKNDDEAAEHFYDADRNYSGYQKLKTKTKNTLINHVFFLNENKSNFSNRERAYFKCYRYWAAAKILLGLYGRGIGVEVAEQVMKQARNFDFSDIVMDVAKNLRIIYGTQEGNKKRFDEYNKLYKHYQQVNYYEDLAEEYYTDLSMGLVNEKGADQLRHEKAKKYYAELEGVMKKYPAYRLHLSGNLIRIMVHTSVNDYEGTIKICQEAIRFFERKSYAARMPLQIFYYQLIVCHTQLKQYSAGKKAAEKCLALLEEGSFNWFKYQELYFILSTHTKNYQQAYRVFLKTVNHRYFEKLPDTLKEIWKIFEAFLQALYHLDKVKEETEDDHLTKFRYGRFINATPRMNKDKRGMNIPILIAQILTLIIHRKYTEAIERIEAIEKYCSRYLTKDDTYRSNCFIKMLLQIPAHNFHRVAVERKAARYLKKLEMVPLDMAKQNHEIEIIPYEELWDMVIGSLDTTIHKVKSRKEKSMAKRKSARHISS